MDTLLGNGWHDPRCPPRLDWTGTSASGKAPMYQIVDENMFAEVTATVRSPDGQPSGVIDGLVVRQNSQLLVIDKQAAIRMAMKSLLQAHVPGDGRWIRVVPVDEDRDGFYDYVRTAPDQTIKNNLLDLPIWSVATRTYVSPFGYGGLAAALFGGG